MIRGAACEILKKAVPDDFKVTDNGDGTVTVEAAGTAAHAAFPEGSESAIQKLASGLAAAGILDEKGQQAVKFLSEGFRDYYGTGLGIRCV